MKQIKKNENNIDWCRQVLANGVVSATVAHGECSDVTNKTE
jgi:hypothetical protein